MLAILPDQGTNTTEVPIVPLNLPNIDLFPYGTFEGILGKVGDQKRFPQGDSLINKNGLDASIPLSIPPIDFSESVPLPVIDASSVPVGGWVVPGSENK